MSIKHGFEPVIGPKCRVVVLGSFPGQVSLDQGHYYANPRNLLWAILSRVVAIDLTVLPFEQRYQRLIENRIGLWDVIAHCDRPGSLDSNIRQAEFSPLGDLVARAPTIQAFMLNGRKAQQGAHRDAPAGIELIDLPSTSPAFASMNADTKMSTWLSAFSSYSR